MKKMQENNTKRISISLLVMGIITLASCQHMIRNEIVNDLKIAETLLPQQIDAFTQCQNIAYDKPSETIVIEYITNANATHLYESIIDEDEKQKDKYLTILANTTNDGIESLLKRCSKAELKIRIINRNTIGEILIDRTYTPTEYYTE